MNLDFDRDTLQRVADRAAVLFVEVFAELESRRVDPGVDRQALITQFSGSINEEGVGLDQALDEFKDYILPNCMGTPHPLYFGLVNSSPLPAGPLADLLVSSLNNNSGSYHQSPIFSLLEQQVIQAFVRLTGFPAHASGMILPGGTLANLQGLMLARYKHFPEWHQDGPAALRGRPLLYTSAVTHFCNQRAASVLGLGGRGVITIPTRGRGEIDVKVLEERIQQDRDAGDLPFAVVANAGTTGTGAIDPLGALADICERHGLWLHADACYGGGALLARPRLPVWDELPRADSIAIDPHKWFFIPMTAGILLTRHPDLETAAFDTTTSYIPSDGSIDAFRRGIPTSRRGSAFTVWMTLRAHGWKSIREAVERNIRLTRQLEQQLQAAGFRVLEDGQLSVACVRWERPDLPPAALDELQTYIARTIIASGKSWFSTVEHNGQIWLRLNLVNYHTREHHIVQLANLIAKTARDYRANH